MTRLRETELPAGIVEVYQQSIQDSGDAIILEYAKCLEGGLLKGIRPIKQNVPQIKKRLVGQIGHNKKLSRNQMAILEYYRPLDFLEDFAFKFLDQELDSFCSVYGRDQVLASLLLDTREEIRALAESVLSGLREIEERSEEEKKNFASNALMFFDPFFGELLSILADGEEDQEKFSPLFLPPQDSSRLDQLEKTIATLERQNKKLSAERKEYKRRAAKSDELSMAKAKAEKETLKFRKKLADREQALAASVAEFHQLDSAIAATVDGRVHSALHAWIKRPEELERESKAIKVSGHQDVALRAESIILKQAKVDRHAGNRRTLLERLKRLEELLQQIEDMAAESINPLGELKLVGQDLEREIDRLRQILGQPAPASGFIRSFMARIGGASHPEELSSYKKLLGRLDEFGILKPMEMRALYEHFDERMSLLYEKFVPSVSGPEPPLDPVYRLKCAIADNTEMLWLLDGHNILFLLPEMFGTFDEEGIPTASSRLALSNLLVRLTRDAPECQVQLFYDGPEYNEIQAAPNVKVVYSGGEGDHRADDAICSVLEYQCYQANNIPFLLTSDDRELRLRAERLGSHLMTINEFFAWARSL